MDAETLPGCDPTAARERFALLPPGSGRLEEARTVLLLQDLYTAHFVNLSKAVFIMTLYAVN